MSPLNAAICTTTYLDVQKCYGLDKWFPTKTFVVSKEGISILYMDFNYVSPSNEGRHNVLVWTITCLSFQIGQLYLVCGWYGNALFWNNNKSFCRKPFISCHDWFQFAKCFQRRRFNLKDNHDITEILLKVALNTITPPIWPPPFLKKMNNK
jgi:hypothetical protein